MDSFRHRPGPLHQHNKPFKGRKRTQPKSAVKGRIEVEPSSGTHHHEGPKKRSHTEQSKLLRRNAARVALKQKREELIAARRSGTAEGAPKMVVLLALHAEVDLAQAKRLLLVGTELEHMPLTDQPATFIHKVTKQRFTVLTPPRDLFPALDSCKIADVIVALVGPSGQADAFGERLVSCVQLQGMPAVVPCLTGAAHLVNPRKLKEAREAAAAFFAARFALEEKLSALDSAADAAVLLRTLATHRPRRVVWRERRSNVLAHAAAFDPATVRPEAGLGTLLLSGYVRGAALHGAQIMHLPGIGDFHIEAILAAADPWPMKRPHAAAESDSTAAAAAAAGAAPHVLSAVDPAERDPMIEENEASPFDAEQTWPTEEEMQRAEALRSRMVRKRVPKGTSDYQAAWIADEDEEEFLADPAAADAAGAADDAMSDGSVDGMEHDAVFHDDLGGDDAAEDGPAAPFPDDSDAGSEMSETPTEKAAETVEEMAAHKSANRARLLELSQQDALFPDEVDTPLHITARARFQKYRGLKSFRGTPWPASENLPSEYARIFQFADFRHTAKLALQPREGGVPEGTYVTVRLLDVPLRALQVAPAPLIAWSLLKHERKISLINCAVMRQPSYEGPIRSKDPVIVQMGFRRLLVRPLYSQNNVNSDKHKFERFLQPGRFSVASFFGPVTYPPMPVLMFRNEDHGLELVAKGSLLSVDPDRVLVKKIVLTGFPYRVNRRFGVVRFMFFNADDVRWFKPVELWTKHGLRGHIREPRGTKGYMKCIFDKPIKMNDTVCMSLYKRVYPPFRAQPLSLLPEVPLQVPAGAMPPPALRPGGRPVAGSGAGAAGAAEDDAMQG